MLPNRAHRRPRLARQSAVRQPGAAVVDETGLAFGDPAEAAAAAVAPVQREEMGDAFRDVEETRRDVRGVIEAERHPDPPRRLGDRRHRPCDVVERRALGRIGRVGRDDQHQRRDRELRACKRPRHRGDEGVVAAHDRRRDLDRDAGRCERPDRRERGRERARHARDRVGGVGLARQQLHPRGMQAGGGERARPRRVDQRAVGLEHDATPALACPLHQVDEVAAHGGFTAGEDDLARVARAGGGDALAHRTAGDELGPLRRPARVAEPAVLVAGLVGDDPFDAHGHATSSELVDLFVRADAHDHVR